MKRVYIQLTLEPELLAKVDEYARRDHRDTRADALRALIKRFLEEHPEYTE